VGDFAVVLGEGGTIETAWVDGGALMGATHDPGLLPELAARLERYFNGEAVDFADVPAPPASPFFARCWAACRHIPWGETATYADLARGAGSPGALRAAGQAMRRNRLPVIIPCHRVVASSGVLHGYAGSTDPNGRDLRRKGALLHLEGATAENTGLFPRRPTPALA
jgi:O-6-methylguanine DNA methyltransferase